MSDVAAVSNPFGVGETGSEPTSLAHVEAQRAVSEVQAAMMVARMNPRNMQKAVDTILNSCTRPSLAEKATYDYVRGGAAITGPSIRLAEVMAQCWGNIQYGIRELSQEDGASEVQAFAWDVETNTRREVTFRVSHSRKARGSIKRLDDPRDVYELVANQGARRLRSCILAVIPGDVVESAVAQCDLTMKAKVDHSPEAIKRMLDKFAGHGVSKEQIEARIQRRVESILPAQMLQLGKIHNSLTENMSVVGDWFPPLKVAEPKAKGVAGLAAATEKPKRKAAKKKAEPDPEPTPAENQDPEPNDPNDSATPVNIVAAYKQGIMADEAAEVPKGYTEEEEHAWIRGNNRQPMNPEEEG